MSNKKIIRGELIGQNIEIIDSKQKSNIGIKGRIMDETKHTITIDKKMIFKKNITLTIQGLKVTGEELIGRPQDRIKIHR